MPDRYWVGGTADWDGTIGTKWALTSGGTGGQAVPTSADDVFFTDLSTGTCTIATGNTGAKSINCTGFTGTIAGTTAISVAGSITLSATQTYTHTGTVTITGTGTLTTSGKSFSSVTIDGVGITVTLGDALNMSSARLFAVTRGTINTNNYALTCGAFQSSNSNVRTINLGSSVLSTTTGSGDVLTFQNSTNLTFNAGTSQINVFGSSINVWGGDLTFYNLNLTTQNSTARTFRGNNTFNNLTFSTGIAGNVSATSLYGNQTVNGTFTCAGTAGSTRGFIRSDLVGTTRTITANAISANDCDFRDITLAGTASGASPTRAGDCGGNSGIIFPAPKTVYWNLGGSVNWTSDGWATTSNGSPSLNNYPLAQDTAVFTDAGAASFIQIVGNSNMGTVDMSSRTSAMTLNFGNGSIIYGSFTLGSGVTTTGAQALNFSGTGTQTLTTIGKTISFSVLVNKPINGSSLELGDALSTPNTLFTLTQGSFDAKNYNVTVGQCNHQGSLTKTLTMGSGLWTLAGSGVTWNVNFAGSFTFNKDTANILLSNNTTTARQFIGGAFTYNKIIIGGDTSTSSTSFGDSNAGTSMGELASTKTVAHTILFEQLGGRVITIGTWSVTGTAGNVVTVNSNTAGSRRILGITNPTTGIDYLSVKDISVNAVNRFGVGINSIDGGNNLNVYFSETPTSNFFLFF
jgi:hypothetical protein